MTERELLDLKEELNETKEEVSILKGEKQSLLKRLKDEWGCSTLKEAEVKVADLKEEIERLDDQIHKEVTKLKEELYDE